MQRLRVFHPQRQVMLMRAWIRTVLFGDWGHRQVSVSCSPQLESSSHGEVTLQETIRAWFCFECLSLVFSNGSSWGETSCFDSSSIHQETQQKKTACFGSCNKPEWHGTAGWGSFGKRKHILQESSLAAADLFDGSWSQNRQQKILNLQAYDHGSSWSLA